MPLAFAQLCLLRITDGYPLSTSILLICQGTPPTSPSALWALLLRKILRTFRLLPYCTWRSFDTLIMDRKDALKPYIEAARWIPLSIHPFASVSTFLYAGLDDTREELEDPRYFLFLLLLALRLCFYRFTADDIGMYDKVMKLVPTLHEVIIEFYEQPLQLQKLILSVSLVYMPTNLG